MNNKIKKYTAMVVGMGYWGPQVLRNLNQNDGINKIIVCDQDCEQLAKVKKLYPHIKTATSIHDIPKHGYYGKPDICFIVTPVSTHYELGKWALENDMHVFIEKPLAFKIWECQSLIEIAAKKNKKLMVGHVFEYSEEVKYIKSVIDNGELGDLYYINAQRSNLGLLQKDINVLWDLAPHDLSIILSLLEQSPEKVEASAYAHINPNIEDVSMLTLTFKNNLVAYIHNSWLDPNKTRRITIVGSKKMLVWDDTEVTEKIKIYNKGASLSDSRYEYRNGEVYIPYIKNIEPLKTEINHFIDAISNNTPIKSDGQSGLNVVNILELGYTDIINKK